MTWPQTAMESAPPAQRPRRIDPLIVTVACIFAAFLAVNGVMLWFTLRRPPELVAMDYVEDARRPGPAAAEGALAERLGWQAHVLPASAPGVLTIRLTDGRGRPLTGATGIVHAYRPSASALDQTLTLAEAPAGSGRYQARFTRPQSGYWKLFLDIHRGPDRLARTLPWRAP